MEERERTEGQSVLCLSYQRPALFERMALSTEGGTFAWPVEKIVVNQDPSDTITTARAIARGWEVFVPGSNLSFSKGNNFLARLAEHSHLLLVNNDVVLTPAVLTALWQYRDHPIVGVTVRHPQDGRITHGGGAINGQGLPYHLLRDARYRPRRGLQSCPWATFACIQVQAEVWDELDGLDEGYHYGYEDLDFCLRALERGYQPVVATEAEVWHPEFGTRKTTDDGSNFARWLQTWHGSGRLQALALSRNLNPPVTGWA